MTTTPTHPGFMAPLEATPLLRALGDRWWLKLLRGIAAIAFGVIALAWPGITLLALAVTWGVYVLVDGVFDLWAACAGKGATTSSRWWLGIAGVVSILAGVVAFGWPGLTAVVLLMFIAAWAIILGAVETWAAIKYRKELKGEWLYILGGLFSIAFGILLFARPAVGALAVVWIIGWYAILAGCIAVVIAFRLRKYRHVS